MPETTCPPLMTLANRVDDAVCGLLVAVESADLDDLADEAHDVKSDLRAHARVLLEILDAIDERLEL